MISCADLGLLSLKVQSPRRTVSRLVRSIGYVDGLNRFEQLESCDLQTNMANMSLNRAYERRQQRLSKMEKWSTTDSYVNPALQLRQVHVMMPLFRCIITVPSRPDSPQKTQARPSSCRQPHHPFCKLQSHQPPSLTQIPGSLLLTWHAACGQVMIDGDSTRYVRYELAVAA